MRWMRLFLLLMLVTVAGGVAAPATATADAGCDAVLGDLPILTDNIQTEWVTQNCSPNYQVRVTLSEMVAGDWQRATCPNNITGQCTRILPQPQDNANCDPFWCDGSNHNDIETWNQMGDPCAHLWRTKVVVYRPNGDIIASDTGPGNTC